MLRFLKKIALFSVVLLVFLEFLFRFVVPATEYPVTMQDPDYMVMKYDITGPTTGTYSTGRLARHRADWRLNNLGWISSVDYTPGDQKTRPRMVVIGDSYVEAVYLDVDSHLARQVARRLDFPADVYTLGAWGVDLGQMVQVARYARDELDPDLMVLVVNHGPLARTPRNLAYRPFNLQLEFTDSTTVVHQPQGFWPHPWGRHIRKSALLRYLRMNAKIPLGGGAVQQEAAPTAGLGEDDRLELSPAGLDWQRRTWRWVMQTLRRECPETEFVFLLDADRKAIHRGEAAQPLLGARLLAEVGYDHPFHALDLTEVFQKAHRDDGMPLHWDHDYHWSPQAVDLAGQALAKFIVERGLLAVEPEEMP